ncbi:AMP-dependent synthetase/ligase [Mycolicibacterium goodii]|uniref:AMP-dependent synthetase/ligase n=1 Tax=Mycolicibacterium goodii TaxID=134601 RepID=UPI00093F1ADC|nr:AMP-dependent synthetase/ligase [Mycolicibacterium goodii]MBU8831792.1 AMP-dependent synthetase/ligase [Mycolicibacterium goodii]OKH68376.1 AMP-binding protein [Mycobacterium sp. SWH-M5]PJK21073.1 long-chain fatty acid--CoA ligase [Mycolicibacterium goodii]ULN50518.1 AMP-dependent synthetase/ligase [Mycolicibacterium goodii]
MPPFDRRSNSDRGEVFARTDEVATRESATVVDAFASVVRRLGDAVAIRDERLEAAYTWRDYAATALRAAENLRSAGLRRGETVGLMLTNRPEFHIADMAVLLAGATPFSLYQTAAPEQLAEILGNTRCRTVITEPRFVRALRAAVEIGDLPVGTIIAVGTPSWTDLISGQERDPRDISEALEACQIDPSDIATLIYTSGTTGAPKGVELMHRNVMSITREVVGHIGMRRDIWSISYLPMAHIAERVSTHYAHILAGFTVVCCPDATRLVCLLGEVQPEVFFAPPRIWEKLRAITADDFAAGVDRLRIRRTVGLARIEVALSGAAPCPTGVVEYFHEIGVPLRETYGMSETAGPVMIADVGDLGSVGRPLPGNEVRLADDGELLVRGPSVMAGYRDRPDATAEALDTQGWLHTGDIARIDARGRVWIVGRKKDLIINSGGKNMSPANIEARLREFGSPLIDHACVIGDGRPYNVALLVVDPAQAENFSTAEQLAIAVGAHVDQANLRLSRVEQIKRFAVLTTQWLPGSDELTPTMKLKRSQIQAKYAAEIEELYASAHIQAVP